MTVPIDYATEAQGKCPRCRVRYVYASRPRVKLVDTACPACGEPLQHTVYWANLPVIRLESPPKK